MGRHVGRWFPEICFESFALEFSQPSAKSFAHKSESQNTMQPARSFRAGFSQASARSFEHRIPYEMIEASSCAKLSGIFLLKIKCPTRRTRLTRPTNKQKAKREAPPTNRKQSAKHIAPTHQPQQNTTRKVNSNEQTEKTQNEGNPFGNQRERRGPHMLNVRSAFS